VSAAHALTSSCVLEAQRVTRRIGDREIVSGVNVTLSAGESVALVGPSGCGKTSLLQMLGLLDRPDDGVVKLGADDAWSISGAQRARHRLERIGFVFQQHNLFESMTALENVALPAWRKTGSRAEATKRARELLDRFGLSRVSGTRAAELSGGEAQRTALARALVNDPELVLADEPTGNLDSASSEAVIASLFEICARGAALLVVTHDTEIASRATRQLRMLDGRLVRSSEEPPD
jgi:ABC-type lipoprotein export system ATPase subunit